MTSRELEYAEKRMQQKWYELVMAEQRGASVQALERMYNAYILAVEEYNHCSEVQQSADPQQPLPVPVKRQESEGKRKKKAS